MCGLGDERSRKRSFGMPLLSMRTSCHRSGTVVFGDEVLSGQGLLVRVNGSE